MTRLHQVLLLALLGAAASFVVEDWYRNLNHFGPLATSDWAFRKMTLVADYTYRIENLYYQSNMPFMFVSDTPIPPGGVVPPLGDKNWKQGKIGMRSSRRTQPGGNAGYISNTGLYNFTLRTAGHPTAPNTLDLDVSGAFPSVLVESDHSVTAQPNLILKISFSEPVKDFNPATHLVASGTAVVNTSSLVSRGAQPDGTFLYTVECALTREGVVSFDVLAGAATSLATSLPSTVAPIWSVLYTRRVGVKKAKYGRLFTLRDKSRPGYPEAGGWYVAAMHANYIPSLGQVLLSGFGRAGGETCFGGPAPGGRRGYGLSFLLDPRLLAADGDDDDETSSAAPVSPTDIVVQPIGEDPEFYIQTPIIGAAEQPSSGVYQHLPIDGDVIYCAGHTTLPDGRVFFTGGARYANLSSPFEIEWGLDYARIFDPVTKTFSAVRSSADGALWRMPLGTAWYPTTGRLPDGRVLVTGGFTAYGTAACVGPKCLNPQINIFDYPLFVRTAGRADPWRVLINTTYENHAIDPGIREYTRIFVLPEPVVCGGLPRQVLMLGKKGIAVLVSTDESTPMPNVLCIPPGGARPSGCPDSSEQSSAVPLLLRGGELMIMGGCDATTQQRIDLYNVHNDTWRSFNTGIRRNVPATLLLPDGTVLLLSGENPDINQIRYRTHDATSDPRYPQTFDPETMTLTTEIFAREDTFRGYHNFASLTHDGTVMLGSGFNQFGDVGCENPNLRLFYPSYLFKGPRPALDPAFIDAFQGQPLLLHPGQQQLHLPLAAPPVPLHATKGVALLAVQDFTHSYGENQRYVVLPISSFAGGLVTVSVPSSPIVFDGQYLLFLLSADGVPSVGLSVRVCTPGNGGGIPCPPHASVLEAANNMSPTSDSGATAAFVAVLVVFIVVVVLAPAVRWAALRRSAGAKLTHVVSETNPPSLPSATTPAWEGREGTALSPVHNRLDPGMIELKDQTSAR